MTDRIHPRAIDATGYVGDGAQYLADDGTWKTPSGGGGSGGVSSVVAGTGIAVDSTDPANPIVSATGGGGSGGSPYAYSTTLVQAGFTRTSTSSGTYTEQASTFHLSSAIKAVSLTLDVFQSDTYTVVIDGVTVGSAAITGPIDGAVVTFTSPVLLAPGAHRLLVQHTGARRIYYKSGVAQPTAGTGAAFVPWWQELASANLPAARLDFYGSTFGSGGDSGAEYPNDPNAYPGTPLGYDVEFNTTGTSLPSGWSWTNQGTSTWETKAGLGLLTPQVVTTADGGQRFILRSLPAEATWTAYLKCGGTTVDGNNNSHIGIALYDSATNKATTFGKRKGGAIGSMSWSAIEVYQSGSIVQTTGVGQQSWIYLSVEKLSGGNFNLRYSMNGITWSIHRSNMAPYSTFDKIGLWVQAGNNDPVAHPFAWFRVR